MDTPLMDEIERRVFFRSPPLHQQQQRHSPVTFNSGLHPNSRPQAQAHAQYHPPTTRNGRLRMLASFLSAGSSSSSAPQHMAFRSGEAELEPAESTALPKSLRHIRSFESSTYSVIDVPTSPNADEELNGLGRGGVMDGSDVAACRTFKPLPPPPPPNQQQPHSPHSSTSRKIFSKIFGIGQSGGGNVRGKGKRVAGRRGSPDVEDGDYPLDGEEGELIDDEACFVDAKEVVGFDMLSQLPYELALQVISQLDLHSIIACLSVCHNWRMLCLDPQVWRDLFMRQNGWKVNMGLVAWKASQRTPAPPFITYSPSTVSRRLSLSFTLPSLASHRLSQLSTSSSSHAITRPLSFALPTCEEGVVPLSLDWKALYMTRRELEQRWRSKSYKPQSLRLSDHRDSVYCLEFDSLHDVLITGSRDKTIKIWSLSTGELRQTLKDHHSGSVLCLKVIASEGFMVSGSSDRTIIVWELDSLKGGGEVTATIKRRLNGHAGGVLDLRVDENWIVSCSKDAVVRVWSRQTLEPYCDLQGHEGPVNAVGLQDDHVISASGDGKMILWDLKTRSKVRTFEGHDRGLACVEFKGDHVISGSNDRKIKIWSASTGECLHTVSGHDLLVRAISFDAESGKLVSASYDKTVKVWDLEFSETDQLAPAQDGSGSEMVVVGKKKSVTATCVREFKDFHTSHIFDVKFDARRIVSSSHDENVVILDFGEALDTSLFL